MQVMEGMELLLSEEKNMSLWADPMVVMEEGGEAYSLKLMKM